MESDVDDATLLRRHVEGDPEAFGVLFARHRNRLWAVALRTMGNPEDAADGLQDAMVAAYRRAGSFRGEAQVTTWLHRVVVNACLDRLRAAKVRHAVPLPDDLEEYSGRLSASPDLDDPADRVADGERRSQVLGALQSLPHEQRAAIVLVDLEGYSIAEAAAILDCAAGTVKSRCSRGRARLATVLRPLLDLDREPPHAEPGNPPSTGAVPLTDGSRAPPGG